MKTNDHKLGAKVGVSAQPQSPVLAVTEPAERALIGDFAPAGLRATAYGAYHLVNGAMALPGAILFGAVWQRLGMTTAFALASIMTAAAAIVLLAVAHGGTGRPGAPGESSATSLR